MSTGTYNGQLSAPSWLRDLGFSSWLLVGFVLIIVGRHLAARPDVDDRHAGHPRRGARRGRRTRRRLAGAPPGSAHRRRDPRPARARRHRRADLPARLRRDLRATRATSRRSSTRRWTRSRAGSPTSAWTTRRAPRRTCRSPRPRSATTLLGGVADGIDGLKSLVFFLAFATLSTLFVLKDGPVMRALHQPAHGRARSRSPTSSRPTSRSRCAATSSA